MVNDLPLQRRAILNGLIILEVTLVSRHAWQNKSSPDYRGSYIYMRQSFNNLTKIFNAMFDGDETPVSNKVP